MGYMLLALMSISLVVSATKEKDRQFMESGVEPYQLKDLLPLLRENHPLQMLAIAVATNDLATGMQNATLVYFFLYVMHNKDLQPIATVVGAPFMLVAILLAPYIAKKRIAGGYLCRAVGLARSCRLQSFCCALLLTR